MSRLPPEHEGFVRAALPAFGRPSDAPVRLLSVSENVAWLLDDDRPLVLRIHRPGYHTQATIESELDWMQAIRRDTAVRVPAPVPAADGRRVITVVADGPARFVDAMSFERGVPADRAPRSIDFERLGRLTAQLHEHASVWSPPSGFTRPRWDLDAILGPAARWGDWRAMPGLDKQERAAIERAAAHVTERVTAFDETPDRFGLIHGDLAPANLLVDTDDPDGGAITVVDFDDCGWSWFLADLAAIVGPIDDPQEASRTIDAWLRGYGAVCPLPAEHLAMIPTFVLLRRIQLLAWFASHPDTTEQPSPGFTTATTRMAERYLTEQAG